MLKRDELAFPDSCLNKAKDEEMLFVLLERDKAAPKTIRAWIRERIKLGLNKTGDAKLQDAVQCAAAIMEKQGRTDIIRINCPDCGPTLVEADVIGEGGQPISGKCWICRDRLYFAKPSFER